MRLSSVQSPRVHSMDCRCRGCRHPELPPRDEEVIASMHAATRFARDTFLGLSIGFGAAALIDLGIGGPGVLSIFGVGL